MFLLNIIIFTWLKIQKVKRVSMRRLFYPCPLAPRMPLGSGGHRSGFLDDLQSSLCTCMLPVSSCL